MVEEPTTTYKAPTSVRYVVKEDVVVEITDDALYWNGKEITIKDLGKAFKDYNEKVSRLINKN